MNLRIWLNNWGLSSLKIKAPYLEMELKFKDADKSAAWELYVELLTRITTQKLDIAHGDEKTALDSIYSLFPITRQVLKNNSSQCIEFAKIAIIVLNQVVRPFTAKWHKLSMEKAFADNDQCNVFRLELALLQTELRKYTKLLAGMAGVEDITELEEE